MRSIIVNSPKVTSFDGVHTALSATIAIDAKEYHIQYRVTGAVESIRSDFLLPVTLASAMVLNRELVFRSPLSAPLVESIPRIQEIYRRFGKRYKTVPVSCDAEISRPMMEPQEVGCLFSGGVDSFYSLLKHQQEITTIIFVHGFDIPLSDTTNRKRVSEMVRMAAGRYNKKLLEVETDLRRNYMNRYLGIADTISPFFSSVALLVSSRVRKIYFPACYHRPLSASAIGHYRATLDPLWSNGLVTIVHDGDEAKRVEKISRISKDDVVSDTLHVCWMNATGADNCGRCAKCLRTMAALRAAGQLDRVRTFKENLDLTKLSRLVLSKTERIFAEDTLSYARESGRDPDLIVALAKCLRNRYTFNINLWLVLMLEGLRENHLWIKMYNLFPEDAIGSLRKKIYSLLLR